MIEMEALRAAVAKMGREDAKLILKALQEALAQPEPWEKFCDSNCVWTDHHPDCKLAKQEPVAYQDTADKCLLETVPAKGTLLHTIPPASVNEAPQRTWVGLTWEDANEIAIEYDVRPSTVKAIEAKLKEKNT